MVRNMGSALQTDMIAHVRHSERSHHTEADVLLTTCELRVSEERQHGVEEIPRRKHSELARSVRHVARSSQQCGPEMRCSPDPGCLEHRSPEVEQNEQSGRGRSDGDQCPAQPLYGRYAREADGDEDRQRITCRRGSQGGVHGHVRGSFLLQSGSGWGQGRGWLRRWVVGAASHA